MCKQKVIIFHPTLAPYRIDFFNFLSKNYNLKTFFESKHVGSQKFNNDVLLNDCNFKFNFLKIGFNIKSTSFRFGAIYEIIRFKPSIIITSEFGFISLLVFIYSFFSKKAKHYIICDDNIQISQNRSGLRAVFRYLFSVKASGVLYSSEKIGSWNKKNISTKINPLCLPIIHDNELFRKKILKSQKLAVKYIEKYDLKGKKVLLYVGRLISIKNIPLILESMTSNDDTILIIVGRGNLKNQLLQEVTRKGISDKVFFLGFKSGHELHSWFSIAHILILPSFFERFGCVVNEALLAGCYVLCSEIAGASSLINNSNGFIFNPHDKADFKKKLHKLLSKVKPINDLNYLIRDSLMPFTLSEKLISLKTKL